MSYFLWVSLNMYILCQRNVDESYRRFELYCASITCFLQWQFFPVLQYSYLKHCLVMQQMQQNEIVVTFIQKMKTTGTHYQYTILLNTILLNIITSIFVDFILQCIVDRELMDSRYCLLSPHHMAIYICTGTYIYTLEEMVTLQCIDLTFPNQSTSITIT